MRLRYALRSIVALLYHALIKRSTEGEKAMYYSSRAAFAAAKIADAQIEVENAHVAYRKGGPVDRVNKANRDLAAAHDELYRINAGIAPGYDR
jgi:hypothetical protein